MLQGELLNLLIEQEQFEHYFQPILNLNSDTLVGGELLLRTNFDSPDNIFKAAKQNNKLYDLDTKSIHKAIQLTNLMQGDVMIFINVFPSTLINNTFPTFIEDIYRQYDSVCNQIIFEINETDTFDQRLLGQRIQLLRKYGFLVAIDDFGKGWPTIQSIIEIEPNYLKLDRYFANDLVFSHKKQDMIKALLSYCNCNDIKVVLEGIENKEMIKIAQRLGINMFQGYYLGMPEKIIDYYFEPSKYLSPILSE
ncbi:EAL domain-containing protein [Calidifontibacillus oryziterrae]|uniref:EAL domain-containing protein n=1 Tax=Calidifontibacillus oryziterrae TaxID=1191699 RepID=UPI0002FAE3B8|nr:EAL domain-containing protein [Calidifontibacillus oryziterrae]